ncbi:MULTISPECIES: hypothetical protein [unclassified Ensifer]|uniref:hypothetical protein n=1 Tax=unclassified Ensifer TaxID=2633371 RepID=UPI00070CE44A|nr:MULTISPECIES: hypothetical protein [unclassified Ensifer]KQW62015.1 hypothetical protein ASD02_21255 [Ensifer sp. Root1252]KQW82123.1 hypothetical protein ASD03_23765 [Ensifer sp. Root127]KRC83168.1 hypothetical protein ASE32_24295 [Ensifer sp. Root231]KRC85041.1 hypothetical protein ASE47_18455 [Ensifer sp. Root258]
MASIGSRHDHAVILVSVAILASLVVADRVFGIDYYDLVRNPNAIARNPGYFGIVSNIGVIFWIVGAAAALQAFAATRAEGTTPLRRTLLAGGLFAALMGIDDFLVLLKAVATTGIPEEVALVPHMLVLCALCYCAYTVRAATPRLLLVGSVLSMGLSFAADMAPIHVGGATFVEEAFKLVGILFLSAYLVTISHQALQHGGASRHPAIG